MDKKRLQKLAGIENLNEADADPKVAREIEALSKKITARKNRIISEFKKAQKAFTKIAAEYVVAETGWEQAEDELQGELEVGGDPVKLLKGFDNRATEIALEYFEEEPTIFDEEVVGEVGLGIQRLIPKVKL